MENVSQLLELTLNRLREQNIRPSLLLHSCCAPCSSYVLEYLSDFFDITVLYFNPNIFPEEEYAQRRNEQQRFLAEFVSGAPVRFLEGKYDRQDFLSLSYGFEHEREGGTRCLRCYEMRLRETAKIAQEKRFDYFTTTLSVSPHKDAQALNAIGRKLSEEIGVRYLAADFKKKDGYKRSIALSRQFGLYRQNYCGCEFSSRPQSL